MENRNLPANSVYQGMSGLTKREWMAGMVVSSRHSGGAIDSEWVVQRADAILDELERTEGGES